MFKIAKSKLPELLKAIAAQQELFLPVNNNGQVNFAAWFEGCNADIETLKTVKSPKDMFFPQSETLYTVKKEQHKLSVEPQTLADQNFVAFGMKACDIQGIKVLDKVFLAEPVDTFYRARREHGTIVALACHEPEESCFCKVFGVDCAEPDADVVMWNANDTLYWKAVTDKGTALTEALSGVLEKADAHPEDGFARITHEEISHHLGTTREVISRELEGMRQMGLLQTGRGKIYVLDRAALEGMANL